jgi:hypothetical protein
MDRLFGNLSYTIQVMKEEAPHAAQVPERTGSLKPEHLEKQTAWRVLFPPPRKLSEKGLEVITLKNSNGYVHLWGYEAADLPSAGKCENTPYPLLHAFYLFPEATFDLKVRFSKEKEALGKIFLLCGLKDSENNLNQCREIHGKLSDSFRLAGARLKMAPLAAGDATSLMLPAQGPELLIQRPSDPDPDGKAGERSPYPPVSCFYHFNSLCRILSRLERESTLSLQFRPLGLSSSVLSLYENAWAGMARKSEDAFSNWNGLCDELSGKRFLFRFSLALETGTGEDLIDLCKDELAGKTLGLEAMKFPHAARDHDRHYSGLEIPGEAFMMLRRTLSLHELAGALCPILELPRQNSERKNAAIFLEAPESLPADGVLLGEGLRDGHWVPIFMDDAMRKRHVYVVGKTGTGKTTLLENLILQDIYNGAGVALIDPHGDLSRSLLKKLPLNKYKDLIYFSPAESDDCGIDIFSSKTDDGHDFMVSQFIQIMVSMYTEELFSPRLQDYTRNFLWTSYLLKKQINHPASLEDLIDFLDNKDLMSLLDRLNTNEYPAIKRFWKNFFAQRDDEKNEMIPYFRAKFSCFTDSPMMRKTFSGKNNSLDFNDILNNGKIFIANLSKGRVSEFNSNVIGSFLVAKFWEGVLQRATIKEEERRMFYLYVDEFQNFITPTFATILSEGRKFGLGLVLANQFLKQLRTRKFDVDTNILEAVLGNIGNIISFRLGAMDASVLAEEMGGIAGHGDFISLKNYHALVKLENFEKAFHIKTVKNNL